MGRHRIGLTLVHPTHSSCPTGPSILQLRQTVSYPYGYHFGGPVWCIICPQAGWKPWPGTARRCWWTCASTMSTRRGTSPAPGTSP
ncbi:protein of unknown function [Candidatus Hydrogenisulfobacillus filiaventi]|uniref:Uncharacterized protein n=1 Tax=Candidatus Hydrogenisulfobacillus filiaventi TaxID=2707344 RepID=A0A6F8ZIW4_9FIRM|nr:protein of unknown function [Candidatus Hydrogenisulfobacillus filiaventi]